VGEEKTSREAIEDLIRGVLRHLQWDLSAQIRELEDERIGVELTGPDRDVVLCNRAEVLEALQHLLNRSLGRESREGQRVLVDCEGYRARKEAELREIAHRVSDRVRRTGEREELGLMNAYERRIVHLAVAETPGVRTESAGDGVMKRVIIHPA
jgi:spoIIIJ-associated protein